MNLDKQLSQEFPKLQIVGLDIIEQSSLDISKLPNLQFHLYDGEIIPFHNNYFDAVLANATLHHTKSPGRHLKEMIRVTKKQGFIIIVEDLCRTSLDCKISSLNDHFRNCLLNPEIKGSVSFLTEREWGFLFKNLSLEVKDKKDFRTFPYFPRQIVYFLKKNASSHE